MLGFRGLRADATNPFYKQNLQVLLDDQKVMSEQKWNRGDAETQSKPQEGSTEESATQAIRPTSATSTAASLAIADEILLRVAPEGAGVPDLRATVLAVIERDKADVLALLRELGEALEGNAEINTYTGEFCTLVNPDWFPRLQRALERHTGIRVLDGVVKP